MKLNLSEAEFSLISDIVNTVNDRCFTPDRKDEDGNWYSNDDFVMMLSNEERELLEKICKRI